MLPQSNGQRSNVDESVDLEHEDEERPKVVEHFREEVPEDSDIWRQVRHAQ